MSPLASWLFVLTVVVAIPVCAVHIAMLLDDRHGWIKRHEKWMADGVRHDDLRLSDRELEQLRRRTERRRQDEL